MEDNSRMFFSGKRAALTGVLILSGVLCLCSCGKKNNAGSAGTGSSKGASSISAANGASMDESGKNADSGHSEDSDGKSDGKSDVKSDGNQDAGSNDVVMKVDGAALAREGEAFPLAAMGRINLIDFSSVQVIVPELAQTSDEEIDEYIEELLAENSQETGSRGAVAGDTMTIDCEATVDGAYYDFWSIEDFDLELGADDFAPGLDEQLLGHRAGEVLDITLPIPEEEDEEMAGKTASLKVTVKSVMEKPVLTQELIEEYSQNGSRTEADFRKELSERLYEKKRQEIQNTIGTDALQKIARDSGLEPSEEYIAYIKAKNAKEMEDLLLENGQSMDEYLEENDISREELDNGFGIDVDEAARQGMVYKKVADEQGISADQEAMEKLARHFAVLYEADDYSVEDLLEEYGEDRAKELAVELAVENYLAGQVDIVTVPEDVYNEQFGSGEEEDGDFAEGEYEEADEDVEDASDEELEDEEAEEGVVDEGLEDGLEEDEAEDGLEEDGLDDELSDDSDEDIADDEIDDETEDDTEDDTEDETEDEVEDEADGVVTEDVWAYSDPENPMDTVDGDAAELESQRAAEEAALLESQRAAEQAALLESQRAAEAAALESQRAAEAAALESQRAAEAAVLESQRAAEQAALLESQRAAEAAAQASQEAASQNAGTQEGGEAGIENWDDIEFDDYIGDPVEETQAAEEDFDTYQGFNDDEDDEDE